MAAPFVLVLPDGSVVGYYTLSATGVKLTELPVNITRKLPKILSFRRHSWAGLLSTKSIKDEATAASCLQMLCFARSVARSHRSPLSSTRRMRWAAVSMT